MKRLKEQIEVMTHFLNGCEVEEYVENNLCFKEFISEIKKYFGYKRFTNGTEYWESNN